MDDGGGGQECLLRQQCLPAFDGGWALERRLTFNNGSGEW
jgi:hypothetical protein